MDKKSGKEETKAKNTEKIEEAQEAFSLLNY